MTTSNETGDLRLGQESETVKGRASLTCYQKSVLFSLVLVALSELVFLLIKWFNLGNSTLSPIQQTICVPMETVQECPGNLNEEVGNAQCCNEVSMILDRLIDKNMKENFEWRIASMVLADRKCDLEEEPVAATLCGVNPRNMQKHEDKGVVLWKENTDMSVRQHVGHKHGRLKIQHSGYYYVYVQTKVRLRRHVNIETSLEDSLDYDYYKRTVQHRLYRNSRKTHSKELLLEWSESECDTFSGNDVMSVSTEAAFHLDHGDELFVQISHADSLLHSDNENIFGVYKI